MTVTNDGTAELVVADTTAVTGTGFSAVGLTLPFTVAPGGSQDITVAFDPTTATGYSGNLAIVSDDSDEPTVNIALSGTGVLNAPDMSVLPASLPFGPVVTTDPVVELSVTVTNAATATADLVVADTTGVTGTGFTLVPLTLPFTLAPGDSQDITVAFDPTTATGYSGNLAAGVQ